MLLILAAVMAFASVQAADPCSTDTTSNTTTCLWTDTASHHTFVVPMGVSELTATVNGGYGGSNDIHNGGLGQSVEYTFDVQPGDLLDLWIGEGAQGIYGQ